MSFTIPVLLGLIVVIIVMNLDETYQRYLNRNFSILSKRYFVLSFAPLTLITIILLLVIFKLLEVS